MYILHPLEYAVLGEVSPEFPNRQFGGLPPKLTGEIDQRRSMPMARVLVVMQDPKDSGSIYLYRYAADGAFAGDTWHGDVEEAKGQAEFEYGWPTSEWRSVPADTIDIKEFVRNLSL